MSINPEYSNDVPKNFPWQSEALCAETDPEVFFPPQGGSSREAKKVCGSCDVGLQCLLHTMQADLRGSGVSGGLTYKERQKLVGKSRAEVEAVFNENHELNKRR